MPRLFVAIDPPDAAREALANLCHSVERARWIQASQFHLTLQFIGDADGVTTEDIVVALSMVEAAPFMLSLKGVGHFPPRRDARVLWAGVSESPGVGSLQGKICAALREAGVEGDRRRFHPHITLARFRDPAPHFVVAPFIAANSLFETEAFAVDEFHLYSSVLARDGAVHTREATYALPRA